MLPVADEVITVDAWGDWGWQLRDLQDGDELMHVDIHPWWALVAALQNGLSSWGGSKEAKLIAEGAGQEIEI